jgi:hypothetical protein
MARLYCAHKVYTLWILEKIQIEKSRKEKKYKEEVVNRKN